jgi:hypothetical protein
MDKVIKSDFILFNADSPNNGATELIIGYIAAQPNSYYFGNLRDLNLVNKSVIYNSDQIINILENHTNKNAR